MVLLKSSDRAVHDISEAFDECASLPDSPPQLQLVLRRYVAMSPEREFRCFVHEHALTGEHATKLSPSILSCQHACMLYDIIISLPCMRACMSATIRIMQSVQVGHCVYIMPSSAYAAICQRHIQECFPGLQQQKQEILQKIVDFQHDHLCEQFALTDYVFDVYINSKGNVSCSSTSSQGF